MSGLSLRGQLLFAFALALVATVLQAGFSMIISPVVALALVVMLVLGVAAWFEGGAIRRRLLGQCFLAGWSVYLLMIGANLPVIAGSAALFWFILVRWQRGLSLHLGSVVIDLGVLAVATVVTGLVFDGGLFGIFLAIWAFFLLVACRSLLMPAPSDYTAAPVDKSYAAARWRLQQLLERAGQAL